MDLRKLTIFREVALHNSFRRAAEALHMAQPAVSIAIQKLEDELGTRLFSRRGRHIKITPEGVDVLARTEVILNEVNDLQQSVAQMNELLKGELTIACPAMLATYFFSDLLSQFLLAHPGLTATITQTGSQHIKEQLLNGDIELGVITLEKGDPDNELTLIELIREQIVVCVSRQHPWQAQKSVRIKQLDNSPMVLYEKDYFIRQTLDTLCATHQVTPDIRIQTNFLPLLTRTVKQGLGTTVGLRMMANEEEGIVGIPLSPRAEVRMAIAKRRSHTISRANQAFLDWLEYLEPGTLDADVNTSKE